MKKKNQKTPPAVKLYKTPEYTECCTSAEVCFSVGKDSGYDGVRKNQVCYEKEALLPA